MKRLVIATSSLDDTLLESFYINPDNFSEYLFNLDAEIQDLDDEKLWEFTYDHRSYEDYLESYLLNIMGNNRNFTNLSYRYAYNKLVENQDFIDTYLYVKDQTDNFTV